jgi:hypothetical protein
MTESYFVNLSNEMTLKGRQPKNIWKKEYLSNLILDPNQILNLTLTWQNYIVQIL